VQEELRDVQLVDVEFSPRFYLRLGVMKSPRGEEDGEELRDYDGALERG
jgi:hypothetical protein